MNGLFQGIEKWFLGDAGLLLNRYRHCYVNKNIADCSSIVAASRFHSRYIPPSKGTRHHIYDLPPLTIARRENRQAITCINDKFIMMILLQGKNSITGEEIRA